MAGPLGGIGLALLLLGGRRELRLVGLAAWAAACVALAAYLAPHGHRSLLAAAAVVGILAAVALAAGFRRLPWALAAATLACAPARIPVSVGSTDANLLVPLYAVVVAAAMLLAWQLARGDGRRRELGAVTLPLALFVAWTGLSLAWSKDVRQGAISLLFFVLPFGVLALALARLPWSRRALTWLAVQLGLMGLLFALFGIGQEAAKHVFWNPKVIVGNAYAPFFRVNSLFWDPSIYGRFLAIAILAALVVVLRGAAPRLAWGATAVIALTAVGLYFSYSQSSFAALAAGTVVAAAFAWRRQALAGAALATVALLMFTGASGGGATSGRAKLIENGVRLALHHPVIGVGVGGFKRAYADLVGLPGREPKAAASHTTPVTVAAETGVPGLLLFLWLCAVGVLVPLRRAASGLPGTVALLTGSALVAIFVHSLAYDSYLEDPLMWAFLALGALVAARIAGGGEEAT